MQPNGFQKVGISNSVDRPVYWQWIVFFYVPRGLMIRRTGLILILKLVASLQDMHP